MTTELSDENKAILMTWAMGIPIQLTSTLVTTWFTVGPGHTRESLTAIMRNKKEVVFRVKPDET